MKYVSRIIAIVLVVGAMFIPAFKITTAIANTKDYISVRKDVKYLNGKVNGLQDQIVENRKAIKEARAKNLVDLEDANALYETVSKLSGVSKVDAMVVKLDGNTVTKVKDFNPKENNSKIQGLRLVVTTKDLNKFLKDLNSLQTPYTTLNIIYPENKVVIIYNTQGGVD